MLIGAIARALDTHYPHAPSAQSVTEDLLCAEHAVDDRVIDLLNKAYSSDSYLIPLNPSSHAFYRANVRISHFKLICKQPRAVQLNLTYRTRQCASEQIVTVRVHGNVEQVPMSNTWTSASVLVSADMLVSGINIVEIHWPAPDWDFAAWKNQIAEGLENAGAVDVSPIYGEIHTFQAAVVAAS